MFMDTYTNLFQLVLKMAIIVFKELFVAVIVVTIFRYVPLMVKFRKSEYKNESGISLFEFLTDKGAFGEGLLFF